MLLFIFVFKLYKNKIMIIIYKWDKKQIKMTGISKLIKIYPYAICFAYNINIYLYRTHKIKLTKLKQYLQFKKG